MEVKHVWITARLTLKFSNLPHERELEVYLTLIEGDDIMSAIKFTMSQRMLSDGYLGFKINTLKLDKIRDPVTCQGCLDEAANQEAHSCLGY